jgi:TatD DNase family protein
MFDTHCHIQFNAYKDDLQDVIDRAQKEGVLMLVVGTEIITSNKAVELAERFDPMYATIGLHPNHTYQTDYSDQKELDHPKIKEEYNLEIYRKLAQNKKVKAVGEIGLDYYRIPEQNKEALIVNQKNIFIQQLDLATELRLPVIIHCRNAHDDMLTILKQTSSGSQNNNRGVIHSFSGTLIEAQEYISLGFLLGFNGIITFTDQYDLIIQQIGLDKIVLETDSPYLTPVPHRGKRNEPAYIKHIAQKIATLCHIDIDNVAMITTANAQRLLTT